MSEQRQSLRLSLDKTRYIFIEGPVALTEFEMNRLKQFIDVIFLPFEEPAAELWNGHNI
jgi:hypothetical protein